MGGKKAKKKRGKAGYLKIVDGIIVQIPVIKLDRRGCRIQRVLIVVLSLEIGTGKSFKFLTRMRMRVHLSRSRS